MTDKCDSENHGHFRVLCSCGRLLSWCCAIADDFEEVREESCDECRLLRRQLEGR